MGQAWVTCQPQGVSGGNHGDDRRYAGTCQARTPEDAEEYRLTFAPGMLGHASAAMTLDIYAAGLFAEDSDLLATNVDLDARVASAEWVRTNSPDRASERCLRPSSQVTVVGRVGLEPTTDGL